MRNEDGVNGTVARDFWLYFKNWFSTLLLIVAKYCRWTYNKLANFLKSLFVSKTLASGIRLRSCMFVGKIFCNSPFLHVSGINLGLSSLRVLFSIDFASWNTNGNIFWSDRWDYLELTICSLQYTVSNWFIPFT